MEAVWEVNYDINWNKIWHKLKHLNVYIYINTLKYLKKITFHHAKLAVSFKIKGRQNGLLYKKQVV